MNSRCQCPFSGPSDTILGCHRDPISSEKGWLDFAVRELSRVAAGKARGQEAVWRSQCKPAWWDCACPHPWKNPTANPKDCKDTLKMKFECLVQHLRKEARLPREMEEEVSLWEADRKAEVFLMTSFSSLLGQASNLHTVVEETCHRMEESGSSVDTAILDDLQSCLTACLSKVGSIKNLADKRNLKKLVPKPASNKRPYLEKDSDFLSPPQSKRPKHCLPPCPTHSSLSASPAPITVQSPPSAPPSSPKHSVTPSPRVPDITTIAPSKIVMAALQRQILQKQVAKTSDSTPVVCQNTISQTLSKPKTQLIHCNGKRAVAGEEGQCSAGTAVHTTVSAPLSACPPATVPSCSVPEVTEDVEFKDFLALEIEGNNDVTDCQFLSDCPFLDSLLRETSPDISESVTPAVAPLCPGARSMSSQSAALTQPDLVQSNTLHSNHDPFIGQSSSSGLLESSPFPFDMATSTLTGLAESDCTITNESTTNAVICSGVRDMGSSLQDIEVVSDSGYSSESSVATPHRSSLDSEGGGCPDLDSPDLEAYLDSLDF